MYVFFSTFAPQIMFLYFWILRLAAVLGHKKARKLVKGQKNALIELEQWASTLSGCEVLWVHAASVGEFEQARPIIERLYGELPFRKILVTFFSPSGYELRKNYAMLDKVTSPLHWSIFELYRDAEFVVINSPTAIPKASFMASFHVINDFFM